ncbi:MAG: hypothetical protein MUC93_03340 [Bacteroidales bacterium]|nr:hypothetical protein [Bacteroidales bacterium]
MSDFGKSRAGWCVKSYEEANHPPVVVLGHAANLKASRTMNSGRKAKMFQMFISRISRFICLSTRKGFLLQS